MSIFASIYTHFDAFLYHLCVGGAGNSILIREQEGTEGLVCCSLFAWQRFFSRRQVRCLVFIYAPKMRVSDVCVQINLQVTVRDAHLFKKR